MNKFSVAESACIGERLEIGSGSQIGKNARVGNMVRIGENTQIQRGASIGDGSYVANNVEIGAGVLIDGGALILGGAKICINRVRSGSSDARKIGHNSTIGPGVRLHDEVELGPRAIIPSQRTITHLGFFGSKDRVVTIYGSEGGPRYSIGCQIGVGFDLITDHILQATNTNEASAGTYQPYLGVFQEAGDIVQDAYEEEVSAIDELLYVREELGLSAVKA